MKVYRVEEHELPYCNGPDCKRRSHDMSWKSWLWLTGEGTNYPMFCSYACVARYARDRVLEWRLARDKEVS